jgi:hypothetical protein
MARHESPADVAIGIRTLFLAGGQLIERMQQTVDLFDLLIAELKSIESELDGAQLRMGAFTDRASKPRTSLDQGIGELQVRIVALERARDSACQNWLALASGCFVPATVAIAGVGVMVLLAAPAAATSFAVGTAVSGSLAAESAAALGTAARTTRTAYGELVTEMQTESDLVGTRVCLLADLGALDQLMKFTLPASSGVIGQLVSIRNAWAGSIRKFSARVNELSVDSLPTAPWLKEQEMRATAAGWTGLDAALRAFKVGALVDADLIDFGSALPYDDSAWQSHFALRRAA